MNLTKRSQEKELLDLGPDFYTHEEYIHCLKKLFLINKLLGFFHSTAKVLKQFSSQSTLLDIGFTHDGLISIRRGFTYVEWQLLLQRAGIQNYRLKWCFPFRLQLMLLKSC